MGAPNIRTDSTRDVTSYNLILQLDRPSTCALFLMRWNAILACLSLEYKTCDGDLAVDLISIPKYLKISHCYSLILSTYKAPEHFTNITSIFLVLITKSLVLQKDAKIEISYYNFGTEGPIRTISSAKANINRCKLAMVNSLHYCLVYKFYCKYP